MNSENTTQEFGHLRIVVGVPEWEPMAQVMSGQPADATYVIQRNLSQGLMARGHALTFVAPSGSENFIFTSDPGEATVAPRTWSASPLFELTSKAVWRGQQLLGIPYLNVFSNYRFFDASLQSLENIDVIYERNGLYNSGLAMAARRLQKPYVVFFEADQIMELDVMNKPINGILRWRAAQLLRFNLNVADCIICVTEVGKRQLINKWNIPANKIVVFPNAVHVDRFKPDLAARQQIRASLGLGEEPVILFVGNFFHWHDVPTLLQAFARSLQACPLARLVLVGDGDRRAEMVKQAAALGLDQAVIFTGMVPYSQVPRYMAAADIAVVPYPPMQQEMWLSPLKLFEYLSSGVAVVASAIGQIIDVIRDGDNGLLVPPGDASAMSEALIKTLTDPNLRSKLGARAREDAVQKYSWETYLSRIERIFAAVIARQPVDSL